jgi:hypothetical protein
LQNCDRVVSKDNLIASVWGGRIVSDSTLTGRINAARKAVGDSGEDQKLYYGIAAYAQFVGRNYEEAMRLSREDIRQRGDFVGAHRVLTAAAAMAGQNDARAIRTSTAIGR